MSDKLNLQKVEKTSSQHTIDAIQDSTATASGWPSSTKPNQGG